MIQVSFIIPVYNATPYIHKCLGSIFALGIPEDEMEIICVNDCSPDNTAEVIAEIAKEHPSVMLINHTENKRQGGGSNTAIRAARGEYAVFMDQDDTILPYDILGEIQYMRDNDLELLLGDVVCVNEDGSSRHYWGSRREKTEIMTGPQFFRNEMVNRVSFGAVWMGIYKVDLLKRTNPFVEKKIYEDADWCWACLYNAKRVQYRPLDMYLYVNNPDSSSHNVNVTKLIWRIEQGLRVWKWALTTKDEHESVMESAEDFCTWNLLGLGTFWKYSVADRKKFYQAFCVDDMKTMQSWYHRYKAQWVIEYPILTQYVLFFVAPLLRLAWHAKKMVKK